MKKIIWIIVTIVVVGLLIFKLAINKKTTENRIYHYDKEKAITVDVDTIRHRKIMDGAVFSGTFEPNKEVKISAETQSKINSIFVDVGSYVNQGQNLVQLDNSLLMLQLQAVDAQIEGLHNDVNRFEVLADADAVQGVQLEKAKLGLKSAKIQRATIKEQINKTTIKAPFSGVITAKMNEIGAFAAPGIPLLQITDIGQLKFTINIPEVDINKFQSNQIYTISADVFPDMILYGKLLMLGSKANMGNSFPVQFMVENTKQLDVKSGMFGKVKISSEEPDEGIIIPSSAIINDKNETKVYVVSNGKAVLQKISNLKDIGSQTLVSDGLNVGDVLITNGFINLFDGANVAVQN